MTEPESPIQSSLLPDALSWTDFWFADRKGSDSLRIIRVGFSVLAAWYFASHFADVGRWFSSTGLLATDGLGKFLEAADLLSETQWRLSPLYWMNSTSLLRLFLLVGIGFAAAAAFVRKTRVASVGLWLCVLWLANRSLMIDGTEELVLCFSLAYLALASPRDEPHWSRALGLRLLQLHTTILIAVTGLTMLSSEIWWDGTGSVSIAAPVQRRLFDIADWLSNPIIHEPLTHAIVLVALLGPIGLWVRRTHLFAYVALCGWCVTLAILSSQWLYFSGVFVLLQGFVPRSFTRGRVSE